MRGAFEQEEVFGQGIDLRTAPAMRQYAALACSRERVDEHGELGFRIAAGHAAKPEIDGGRAAR